MKSNRVKNPIVITESSFDAELLQKVLPESLIGDARFVTGMGYSSAISKAKSLALRLEDMIVLVLDSDTLHLSEANEKRERIEFVFKSLGKERQVKAFLFQPEIEVIFFESKFVSNKLSQLIPGFNDFSAFKVYRDNRTKRKIMDSLDKYDLDCLRKETSLKELIKLFEAENNSWRR